MLNYICSSGLNGVLKAGIYNFRRLYIAIFLYVQQEYYNKLQYPVNIKNPNAKLAKVIISQLGGPDGELAASLRYLNQRYVMPYGEVKGILTDIGISLTKLHHYPIFQNQSLFL